MYYINKNGYILKTKILDPRYVRTDIKYYTKEELEREYKGLEIEQIEELVIKDINFKKAYVLIKKEKEIEEIKNFLGGVENWIANQNITQKAS